MISHKTQKRCIALGKVLVKCSERNTALDERIGRLMSQRVSNEEHATSIMDEIRSLDPNWPM